MELLGLVCCFGFAYHCRPFVLFMLAIFPIDVIAFTAGSSLCPFDCSFCQWKVLVPPWCFLFPWVLHGDSVVGCFVDEVGDVSDGMEGVLSSLEV